MKTLADFKRAMRTGTKWTAFHMASNSTLGTRECVYVDTVKFGFKTETGTTSYCDFPKAKDVKFLEDGMVHIYSSYNGESHLRLSYKQV